MMSRFLARRARRRPAKDKTRSSPAFRAASALIAVAGSRCDALSGQAALLDFLGRIDFACLVLDHHRNAVADVECQPVGLADEFLFGLAVQQRPLADWTHQDIKQS